MRPAWIVLLALLAVPARAEPGVTWAKTNAISHASLVITETAAPITIACGLPLDDIIAGETVLVNGDITVTNPTVGNVGFTTEIYTCAADKVTCRNVRSGGNYSGIEGGNVTPGMHHATFQPRAMVSWSIAQPRTWLMLMVRAYDGNNFGGRASVDRCGLLATRYRP